MGSVVQTVSEKILIDGSSVVQNLISFPPIQRLINYLQWSPLLEFFNWFHLRFVSTEQEQQSEDPTITDISILYQSDNYIVVNKRHDIVINGEDHELSVQKQLCHLFPHLVDPSVAHQFRFAHRLDFSTSGALCIALNKEAAAATTFAFTNRKTKKYYLSMVRGHVMHDALVINVAVGINGRPLNQHKMCSADKDYCEHPRKAMTQAIVLQRGWYDSQPATKLLLRPITGRRHQLRVHCDIIGHTIVGDFTYSNRQDVLPRRMYLHAYRLVIPTPTDDIDITTEDPFTDAWDTRFTVDTVTELDGNVFGRFENNDSFINLLESRLSVSN